MRGENMSKKSVTLLFFVVFCLLIGSVLIYFSISKKLEEGTIYTVKVNETIEPNQQISKDKLEKSLKRIYYLPKDTILDASMIGKYAKTKLLGGREILSREVDPNPTIDSNLGYNLKPGEKTVSITLDNTDSVGGIVSKGQFVDVKFIRNLDQQKKILKPLFNHVEVLDVRSKYGVSLDKLAAKENNTKIKIVGDSGVTDMKDMYPLEAVLRVNDGQSNEILLAKKSGSVTISINPLKEDSSSPAGAISTDDLINGGVTH
jgi:Flp pilus assembly protein CpaB